jgi:hypothetical protein
MDSLDLFFGVLSSSLFGLKACLHKTNWSSQPPESILPCQPPLSNSAWWATGAALQAPLQPVLSLSHQVRSLGPLIVDSTHSILSLAHQILYFALLTVTLFPITPLMSQHASSSSQTIPSQSNERLLSRMKDGTETTPYLQDLTPDLSREASEQSNSSERGRSPKQRPYSKSKHLSLLKRLNPPMKSSSVPYHPILPFSTTSRKLVDRISPGQQGNIQKPLSKEPLNLAPLRRTLLSRMGQSQTLTSSSFQLNPIQGMPEDSIQLTQNQRMWKRGSRSATGPQSMRSSSHGKASQQSFEPDLSKKC